MSPFHIAIKAISTKNRNQYIARLYEIIQAHISGFFSNIQSGDLT